MPVTLPTGTIVRSRYQIERLLDKARSGGVYLVKDLNSKQQRFAFFVLKELAEPSRQARHHFTLNAISLTKLEHPALPRILRTFSDDDYERVYLVMAYIEGIDLETLRLQEAEKRFSLEKTMALMTPVLDAVSYLHHQAPPVIHQNITPAAIIISPKGDQPVLINLGVPGECGQDMRPDFDKLSSYEAPELYSDGPDSRTDIYSLGATFYALLSGTPPSDAFYRSALQENNERDPLLPVSELVPSISQPVANVIHKAMSIDRHDRYATVDQFVKELKAALGKKQVPVPVAGVSTGPRSLSGIANVPEPVQVPETPPARPQQLPVPVQSSDRSSTIRMKGVVILLVMLVLLIGGSFAIYMLIQHNAPSSPKLNATTVVPQTSPVATHTTGTSPTSTLNGYPRISGSYAGTIVDQAGATKTNLFLTSVKQNQATLQGDFTGLQVSGPFRGSIDRAGNLQLTVTDEAGRTLLFLEGGMQSPTSLSGDYYPCGNTHGGPCQRIAGGGIWNALYAG